MVVKAEAAIILLARRRAKNALRKRVSAAARADGLYSGVVASILQGRRIATLESIAATRAQLSQSGIFRKVSGARVSTSALERSEVAAERAAHGTTNRYLTSQLDNDKKFDVRFEINRFAVSEAVDAFTYARNEYLEQLPRDVITKLVKTLRSAGDRRVCPMCEELDGETVPANEPFSRGDPPFHGFCRCTFSLDAA